MSNAAALDASLASLSAYATKCFDERRQAARSAGYALAHHGQDSESYRAHMAAQTAWDAQLRATNEMIRAGEIAWNEMMGDAA